MFDFVEAYNGNMVSAEGSVHSHVEATETGNLPPQTAEDILQHAREEAAEMLESAQAQAEEYLAQKQMEAEEEAKRLITFKVNQTLSELGPDLWSAKAGITEIVEQSINLMLGAIGAEKAFALAVNKATHDYVKASKLTVYAHPDSANRLRLYNISNPKTDNSANYEIIDDTGLERGRCILDTGNKRIEVSLDIQLQAIKNSIDSTLSGGKS